MRFHFQLWHSVCLCHSRDKGPSAWASSPSPIPVSGKQDRRHVQYKTHRSTNLQDTFLHIIHLNILLPSGVFLDSTILTHHIVVLTHWRGHVFTSLRLSVRCLPRHTPDMLSQSQRPKWSRIFMPAFREKYIRVYSRGFLSPVGKEKKTMKQTLKLSWWGK